MRIRHKQDKKEEEKHTPPRIPRNIGNRKDTGFPTLHGLQVPDILKLIINKVARFTSTQMVGPCVTLSLRHSGRVFPQPIYFINFLIDVQLPGSKAC